MTCIDCEKEIIDAKRMSRERCNECTVEYLRKYNRLYQQEKRKTDIPKEKPRKLDPNIERVNVQIYRFPKELKLAVQLKALKEGKTLKQVTEDLYTQYIQV